MQRIKGFIKNEAVLLLSFLLAAASAFFVAPSRRYLGYIDFRTLALLTCLMAVMAGLNSLGVFRLLAAKLLMRVRTVRGLGLTLCLLCFFSSMLITNDVALITFVPFSISALKLSGKTDKLISLVVLETVAANLGSMLTPVGNPQNLYLFSYYNMSGGEFFRAVFPYALLSLGLIVAACLLLGQEKTGSPCADLSKINIQMCASFAALFLLALLTVFRVVPYAATLCVTLAFLLAFSRRTFSKIDWSLLLTFVFLFIFIGNLGNIAPIADYLKKTVGGREVIAGVLASQVFSNVPAAILLSGFTKNASALLIGVNLGGLGTLIASMASLISFRFAAKESVKTGKYLLAFTLVNVCFLVPNMLLYFVISRLQI